MFDDIDLTEIFMNSTRSPGSRRSLKAFNWNVFEAAASPGPAEDLRDFVIDADEELILLYATIQVWQNTNLGDSTRIMNDLNTLYMQILWSGSVEVLKPSERIPPGLNTRHTFARILNHYSRVWERVAGNQFRFEGTGTVPLFQHVQGSKLSIGVGWGNALEGEWFCAGQVFGFSK
jgi:hypothetical protein